MREDVGQEVSNFFGQYASEELNEYDFAQLEDEDFDANWEAILLAQIDSLLDDADQQLAKIADVLAQLDEDQLERLNELVEIKSQRI